MIKLDIEDLQNILKKPILRNISVLGLDIASRTGWCLIKTNSKTLTIDYGFVSVDNKNQIEKMSKYIEYFNELIQPDYKIVIEDCYFGGNPLTLKLLAKLEGIAFAIASDKKVKEAPMWIGASTARKNIGCKGNTKKPEVAIWIEKNLGIKLEDEDASDAVVLALNGIIKND